MMKLHDLTAFFGRLFDGLADQDYSNNGLQVEASTDIQTVAFAVDACQQTIDQAIAQHADLLFVHHGISWGGGLKRLDGYMARRLAALYTHRLSLYAMHLPLDLHPEIGNNAVLANLLDLQQRQPFFLYHGQPIGFHGLLPHPMTPASLARLMDTRLNTSSRLSVDAGRPIHSLGIVSGGGDDAIFEAAELHLDALLTGEFRHQQYHPALELGLSVIASGHYATETTGPRALMELTRRETGLSCIFIDTPTGL